MTLVEMIDLIKGTGKSFGAVESENCYFRSNVGQDAFIKGGAYFGYVQSEEGAAGPFHDFSYTVFPDNENRAWLVCFGIGSLGFRNDYELASQPGVRRRFLQLLDDNSFIKTSFLDIETGVGKEFASRVPHLKKTIDIYKKVLPVCEILTNPYSEEGQEKLIAFLALYADMRGWATNSLNRKAIADAIKKGQSNQEPVNDVLEVEKLIKNRQFIVLQGAPGTGKTRLAKEIAQRLQSKVFFTQFHAETSFADFVWGIRPCLEKTDLSYIKIEGPFTKALKYALDNPNVKVTLIIDEINRANLANVLGPAFYLFEYKMSDTTVDIPITNDLEVSKIPENLFVIATMNTADRSLAVVDYALRRRFAWYTLTPKEIVSPGIGRRFYVDDFQAMEAMFLQYATDEELNLQPGQGYYIASSEEEMRDRLRYEVMPLVKEYLMNGLLTMGKDEFTNYFYQRLQEVLFQ